MVLCIDTSGFIYSFLVTATTNVTGSLFLTTLLIALFLLAFTALFGIPIEFTAIILLPLHLGFLACLGTDWLAITGVVLIYLGFLLAKNFFFRR